MSPSRPTTPKRRVSGAAAQPLTARATSRPSTKGRRVAGGRRPLSSESKELLVTLRAREAELEAKLLTPPELPEITAGGDDVHLVAEALVVDNAAKSFDLRQLEDTRTAIAAVAKGQHGICLDCQGPIPAARLAVVPDATRCVPCASSQRR